METKNSTKLSEIYYQPDHLWMGNKAIKKLQETSKLPRKTVLRWLSRQLLWIRYIRGPKIINHPHFKITKPDKIHQFDLLYMPHDKLYGNKYKYVLTGIDVASRFKVARPLKTKKAS